MCKDCGCSLGGHHEHHEHSHHHHHHPSLNETKTLKVLTKILDTNIKQARDNQNLLHKYGIYTINLMSSPGSGKTTLLENTIKNTNYKIGVIEGDLETNKDADRVLLAGGFAHQITTGQTCHLDAFMVKEGLEHLPLENLDIVFIENVGNLVCPASYDLGVNLDVVLLSVPEGSDKVAKYPVMFRKADLVIVTKSSLKEHFNFSLDEVKNSLRNLGSKADVIELDSITCEGMQRWFEYLKFKMELS